jgi:hypothetical protein
MLGIKREVWEWKLLEIEIKSLNNRLWDQNEKGPWVNWRFEWRKDQMERDCWETWLTG